MKSFDGDLTHIYVTHGHGDHFFGIQQLVEAFPAARAVGTRGTVAAAYAMGEPAFVESFWEKLFPGQIPQPLAFPEVLDGNAIELEGHRLEVVEAGFTDTADTTALWVPDLRLMIAGDVAYNDKHQYTAETTSASREQWAQAAEKLAAFDPVAVIAGHKKPTCPTAPRSCPRPRPTCATSTALRTRAARQRSCTPACSSCIRAAPTRARSGAAPSTPSPHRGLGDRRVALTRGTEGAARGRRR